MKTFAKAYFFSSCIITLFAGLVLMVFIPVATSAEGKSSNGHSKMTSPSDYGQSLQRAGPNSPVASGEDHGRAATFRAALEVNGFLVRSGQMTPIDPIINILDSGIGDSANGINAGQPYKVLMVPIFPFVARFPSRVLHLTRP
jgi:hypothetical protein